MFARPFIREDDFSLYSPILAKCVAKGVGVFGVVFIQGRAAECHCGLKLESRLEYLIARFHFRHTNERPFATLSRRLRY